MTSDNKDTFEGFCDVKGCYLNELSKKSSKRKMYKPVKKIATTFARPVEWARFSSFRTDAIYVPVDRCQTQTTFSPVDGKVSVQETVTVKKELAPVENDLAPVKIEPVQKKAYRPKKTLRYSKKNMTPEQIQDYYYARQVQIKENFNLRSRALSPCSQFRDRTYAECPVTTDAIPSGRRTRQYRVTHELAKLIGVTKVHPEVVDFQVLKHMRLIGNYYRCSPQIAKSLFSGKEVLSFKELHTRLKKHLVCVI